MIKIKCQEKIAPEVQCVRGAFFTDRGRWLCSAYQQPRRGRGTVTVETGELYVLICFKLCKSDLLLQM